MLMGLWGSKSNETFFSLPSSVRIVPTKRTRPFGGTRLYSLSLCCVEVIAASTERRLTRDLMLEAVPYSCVSIAETREIWSCADGELIGHRSQHFEHTFGGMMREIMEVPALHGAMSKVLKEIDRWTYPLAASRLLMSFLTFHI